MEHEPHEPIVEVPPVAQKNAIDSYNKMYEEARKGFYAQQDRQDAEKIIETRNYILESTKNRALDNIPKTQEVYTISKDTTKASQPSWLKRLSTFVGISSTDGEEIAKTN